jgi:glucosyl-3-phosphoglycerate phosphatase
MQGQIDIPLDDVGRWQAAEGARHLSQRHRPARIVASDLERATSTAQMLSDLVGVPVEADARLRERHFGEWEGRTAKEISDQWPEEYEVWRSGGDPKRTGAETRAEVAERVALAVEEHAAELTDTETLVVVAHGAAITLGITALLGLDASWRIMTGLTNAHWSLLHPSGRQPGRWHLEAHNLGPSVTVDDWNAGVPPEALPSSSADAWRQ